jgi:hypothetical protein
MAACELISNAYRCRKNKIIFAANACGIVTSERRLKAYEHYG